ncbi:DUF4144 family protein [Vibrio tapetis subsp. quintayensis]|uniref:DUF4144 family protein n=1 Tax=Vibrio tapetis TaxID=52443 RepID=UPI0025B5C7C3|nr:DUF4144 family protein [Vibrio tapetis]MDN3678870.1 DUF4144 family protein [Vibrio tapetis subsp. quintayensis]
MILWPCIFKLEGDSELLYFASELELTNELNALIWDQSDRLIDSDGQGYVIRAADNGYMFEPESTQLSLESVTALIREHEFSKAEMCLTKIQFPSIQEAIMSLALET